MTDAQLEAVNKAFWNTIMSPVFEMLNKGEYTDIPEIQKLYTSLAEEMHVRYGKPAKVRFWVSENCMSSGTDKDVPLLYISIHCWMRILRESCNSSVEYKKAVQHGQLPKKFTSSLIIALLHETLHLATGLVGQLGKQIDVIHMFYSERIIWAKTCKDVIGLFMERGMQFNDDARYYWDGWIRCGMNEDSLEWRVFIERVYRDKV